MEPLDILFTAFMEDKVIKKLKYLVNIDNIKGKRKN